MLAAQGKDGVPATGKYRDESITLQVRNTIKDTFNLLSKECPIPIIIKTLKNFSTPEMTNSMLGLLVSAALSDGITKGPTKVDKKICLLFIKISFK